MLTLTLRWTARPLRPPGIGIGANAALISIITAWLSDIKLGYCTTGWWLSQKFCCLELSDEGTGCEEWRSWGGIEPFRYIAYVLFAVGSPGGGRPSTGPHRPILTHAVRHPPQILFSFSAAKLVKSFAPYAAGSGISEIKCLIGGFVINGFLSVWTLAIKSLSLPLVIASGLQVGKEGPSVHVACCVGNNVAKAFPRYRGSQSGS